MTFLKTLALAAIQLGTYGKASHQAIFDRRITGMITAFNFEK